MAYALIDGFDLNVLRVDGVFTVVNPVDGPEVLGTYLIEVYNNKIAGNRTVLQKAWDLETGMAASRVWNLGWSSWSSIGGTGGGDALTTQPLSQFASTTSAQLAGVISNETGTGLLVYNTGAALASLTAFSIRSSGAAFDVTLESTEALTAGCALKFVLNNANRQLTIAADAVISGTNSGDQTITLTGDVTGSGTGSFATAIANSAVTNAKLANVSTATIKGRITAATGAPEDLTAAQVRTIINVADGANNYVHPNHSGDVSSVADGATTIAADAVTNAKLANVATQTIKGRTTTGTGDPEDLTAAQARAILNVADGANNYVHPNHSGDVTSVADGATTIANSVVTNAKLADVATATFKGRTTAGTGAVEDLTVAQAKTLLNLTGTNSGDQTITLTSDVTGSGTGSFAATIADNAVTNAKLADMLANTVKVRAAATTGDPSDVALAASQLLGRGSTGDVAAITLGTNLSMSGATLNATGGGSISPPQGRLTLTTLLPVTVADVTAATTIYYTPDVGDKVPVYNGTVFEMKTFAELSQATTDTTKSPAAVGASANYDLFVWDDGGTMRCTRGPAWSSGTSRGTGAGTTELEHVLGFYVNKVAITNGPAAQRGTYVGTVRSTSASQIEDSSPKRFVWNAYNRQRRVLYKAFGTNSWNYSSTTWRQAGGDATFQVELVVGIEKEPISLFHLAAAINSTATARNVRSAIGLDSTTTHLFGTSGFLMISQAVTSASVLPQSSYFDGHVGLGYHYLAGMEKGHGADTQTWYGDVGGTELQTGLSGFCSA